MFGFERAKTKSRAAAASTIASGRAMDQLYIKANPILKRLMARCTAEYAQNTFDTAEMVTDEIVHHLRGTAKEMEQRLLVQKSRVMAISIDTKPTLKTGQPRMPFEAPSSKVDTTSP